MPRRHRRAVPASVHVKSIHELLDGIRWFLRSPGRYLYLPLDCPGCPGCDPATARDDIETLLGLIPDDPRLRRIVAEVDAEFLRRTLPNPRARPGPWWFRRLYEH